MKMGVCAPLGGQKRFLCEIRGINSDFGDFFSNIGQSLCVLNIARFGHGISLFLQRTDAAKLL